MRHLTEAATVSGYLLIDLRQPVEYQHEHLRWLTHAIAGLV